MKSVVYLVFNNQAILLKNVLKEKEPFLHRIPAFRYKMISFILEKYSSPFMFAEPDKDSVNFYKNYGFKIVSLGEKYLGVERFQCILKS
ncbi:hypothetical protein ABE042_04345 [Viridibacillus arvi]|uniref:hypothetical protein n=1 Tax=Viridibacillus arvi TaxID=263475 RepID=UPI003D270D63